MTMTPPLESLSVLREQAAILLSTFASVSGDGMETLGIDRLDPQPSDYRRVFRGEAADIMREWFAGVRAGLPAPGPREGQSSLHVVGAWGADIDAGIPDVLAEFPGGYSLLRGSLQPGPCWFCWRWTRPGARRGTAWDGLIHMDGRWIWLPKPWRALRTGIAG